MIAWYASMHFMDDQDEGTGNHPKGPAAIRHRHLEEIPHHEIPPGRVHGSL